MSGIYDQWIRRISLLVESDKEAIDLSNLHIKFSVQNANEEQPNNASIRVYNLSEATITKIIGKGEFNSVILNAGYVDGKFGVIFSGSIKQYKIGRENPTTTYLDILAADGDFFYNQAVVNFSSKGTSPAQDMTKIANENGMPLDTGLLVMDAQHHTNIRGTVQFGLARTRYRNMASSLDASWSIQNGQIVFISKANQGYPEGTAVRLNVATGLIGMPEQTDEGIKITCLLNSALRIGGLVQVANADINQLMQRDPNISSQIAFNSRYNTQDLAALSKDDGIYQMYVVEHEGDNRGGPWYSHIIGLAVDPTAKSYEAIKAP